MATLNFKGKALVWNHHLSVPYHQLVPLKDKSLTDKVRLDDNLVIHGDNLKALKALLPTYGGKVKCVYIDPPYNTGNEGWVYNDAVNSPMIKEWLGNEVGRDDLTRHDKWLCMMTPRLKLLRELLRDDGAIFISLDDNEHAHLRALMDEVFGEENFMATIVWQKRTSPDARATIGPAHDYIIAYAKDIQAFKPTLNLLPLSEERRAAYQNPDNDARGPWASVDLTGQTGHATKDQFFTIVSPGGKRYPPPEGRCWALAERTFKRFESEGRIWFGKDGKGRPRLKRYLTETEGTAAWTWWPHEEVGHNQDATQELNEILGKADLFNNPKPVSLLKRILQLATGKDSLILDSFAGSGSMAHAALAQNREDGGSRRTILIECEDYADKITAERVRRVIRGIRNAKDSSLREGLGGTFSFFELGESTEAEQLLSGKSLPSYADMARYVFYSATGQEFDTKKIDEKHHFIGSDGARDVFLIYKPDAEYLRTAALTLDIAKGLKSKEGRRKIVFAPTKYLDQDQLDELGIDFAQLPYDLYKSLR